MDHLIHFRTVNEVVIHGMSCERTQTQVQWALEIPGMAALGDDNVAVLDVVAGQLLAFFRCLAGGLRPDMPSSGVISRVVNEFTVRRRQKGAKDALSGGR